MTEGQPILSAQRLCKSFGAVTASQNVSLDLRQGEIHALIGPNGAGKSCFIRMIAGDLNVDSGTVSLDGENVTALDTAARARAGLARTFQISSLLPEASVLQNAVLGALGRRGKPYAMFGRVLRDRSLRESATEALETVGLGGLHQTRSAELSHGQRRQLEIGVALTLQPRLFLMDEPMAGLSAEGSNQLTGILSSLRHQAPILLVEHDMDAVFALADRITVLVAGEVIATGTPDEIRIDPVVRSAYLGEDVS